MSFCGGLMGTNTRLQKGEGRTLFNLFEMKIVTFKNNQMKPGFE
jgi:hypothetical protein